MQSSIAFKASTSSRLASLASIPNGRNPTRKVPKIICQSGTSSGDRTHPSKSKGFGKSKQKKDLGAGAGGRKSVGIEVLEGNAGQNSLLTKLLHVFEQGGSQEVMKIIIFIIIS
jgi:hypothetical protein